MAADSRLSGLTLWQSFQKIALSDRTSTRLLWFLLGIDMAFVFLHIAYSITDYAPLAENVYAAISTDHGYGEFFQYFKLFGLSLIFLLLFRQKRLTLYFAWACLLLYMLADDALRIHERVGRALDAQVDFSSILFLGAKDIGQLLAYAVSGVVLIGFIAVCHQRQQASTAKSASLILFIFMIAFAIFSIGIDTLHSMAAQIGKLYDLPLEAIGLGLIEDGGEMIVISGMLWFAYRLYQFERSGAQKR